VLQEVQYLSTRTLLDDKVCTFCNEVYYNLMCCGQMRLFLQAEGARLEGLEVVLMFLVLRCVTLGAEHHKG
jgi:hypothetical protein